MKKILLLITLIFASIQMNAQSIASIKAAITAAKAVNRAWYSCAYDNCLTLEQEAFMHDTTLTIDSLIASLIGSGCTCDLQGVLNNGNAANETAGANNILLQQFSGNYDGEYDPKAVTFSSSATLLAKLSGGGGSQPFIQLRDLASGYNTTVKSTTLSVGNQTYYLPNESTSFTTFQSTLVSHETKDSVRVKVGSNATTLGLRGIRTLDNLGGISSFLGNTIGGSSHLQIVDTSSSSPRYFSFLASAPLTANHKSYLPDETSASLLDATLVSHKTKDPITVDAGAGDNTIVADNSVEVTSASGSGDLSAGSLSMTNINTGITLNSFVSSLGRFGVIYSEPTSSTLLSQNLDINVPVTGTTVTYVNRLPLRDGTLAPIGTGINGTPTANAAAGAGATATLSARADDVSGTITITAGAGTAIGSIFTYTYVQPYARTPILQLTAANDNAALIPVRAGTGALGSFDIFVPAGGTPLTTGQVYIWNYTVSMKEL